MKNVICLLLALCMALCLFAGCAGQETPAAEPADTPAEAPAEAPAEEPAAEPAQAPVEAPTEEPAEAPAAESAQQAPHDYTWQAIVPADAPETITMLTTEVNLMGPLGELGITGYEQFDYFPKIAEATNVTLECRYLSFMTWSEQYQLFIAAGDYTDLVRGGDYTGGLEQGVEDEYLLDFTPYVQELMPNYYNRLLDYGYLEDVTLNGRFLQVSAMYNEYRQNQGLLIRQDWLDGLGLDTPETWEDFYTALKGFRDVYNAEWPIYLCQELTVTNFGGFDVPYQSGSASDLTFYQEDGTVIASVTTQEQKDYLAWLNRCWEAGILNPDFITTTSDATSPNFNNIVSGGQIGLWPSSTEGLSTLAGMTLPDGFAVSALIGPHENGNVVSRNSDVAVTDNSGTILTVEALDNIQAVASWLDFWYSDQGVLLHNYGIEGVDYTLDDAGQPQFTDAIIHNSYGLTASNYLRCRTAFSVLTGLDVRTRTAFEYTDQQLQAWDLWTSTTGTGERVIPTNATVSTDESDTYTNLASDLATVCNEWLTKFVLGDRDLDTEWDAFQQTLSDMGLERCTQIKQNALDSYYAGLANER